MKKKRIKTLKTLFQPKLVKKFWVLLAFTNFYQKFINGFNKISACLTWMLRMTLELIISTFKSFDKACGVKVGSDVRVNNEQAVDGVKSDKYVRATMIKTLINFIGFEAQSAFY